MHPRYTYGNRNRVGLPYSLQKAPLSNTLISLKGSVVNSEELLRRSLAQVSVPKENADGPKAANLSERKGLRDVTNLPSTSLKVPKKAVPKPLEPLPAIVELPSILSSPLIISGGRPVINRTPPSERVLLSQLPVKKPLEKPVKSMKKRKNLSKQSKKIDPSSRGLAKVEELKFVVRPEDIGNKIWIRRSTQTDMNE